MTNFGAAPSAEQHLVELELRNGSSIQQEPAHLAWGLHPQAENALLRAKLLDAETRAASAAIDAARARAESDVARASALESAVASSATLDDASSDGGGGSVDEDGAGMFGSVLAAAEAAINARAHAANRGLA